MGRKLRWAPEGGVLFEIIDRTIHGPLFRSSRELNEIALGIPRPKIRKSSPCRVS